MTMVMVDVSLDDFDEDELVECVRDMGYVVNKRGESREDSLNTIFEALHLGKDEEALRLMRLFISDETGRVL